MKLIECHIAGFGTFTDFKLSFDEGLNVILQPNGWGKTTLAAYIKAMLYGFDRKRKRDVSENERLRYKPWHARKYGGTLDFEFGGHEYRIARSFGATAAGDQLKVVDIATGRKVDLKDQEPGEWIFGLDCAAFQKSVFVGQNGFAFDGSTAGLRNRLNAFVNEADDVSGLDAAKAALEERRKFYIKTGNRGHIAEISQQMTRLVDARARQDMQVAQVARLHEQLLQLDKQADELAAQAQAAQAQLDEARKGASDLGALGELRSQLEEQQRQAAQALARFDAKGGKAPNTCELEKLNKAAHAMDRYAREEADAAEQARQADAALQRICDKYAGQAPRRADVEARRAQLAQWRQESASQRQAQAGAGPDAEARAFAGVEAALAGDPAFVEHAEQAAQGWRALSQSLNDARAAQMRLDVAAATWQERKASLSALVSGVRECEAALPEDAAGELVALDDAAWTLREGGARRDAAERRLTELRQRRDKVGRDAAGVAGPYDEAADDARGGTSPAGIVCVILGVLVAAVGFVLLAVPISFAVAAAGLVLALVGVVLLSKARGQARARAEAAGTQRGAAWAAQDTFAQANRQVEEAQGELSRIDAELGAAMPSGELASLAACSWSQALGEVERRRDGIEKAQRDADAAYGQLAAALGALGADGVAGSKADVLAAAYALLAQGSAPQDERDVRIVRDAYAASEALRASLAPYLAAFDVPSAGEAAGDLALACDRLTQAVAAYRGHGERVRAARRTGEDARRQSEGRRGELDAWAKSLGLTAGALALTDAVFDALAYDAEQAERCTWQAQKAREEAQAARDKHDELASAVAPLRVRFGIAAGADLAEALKGFSQQAAARAELEQRSRLAAEQLAAWDKDHAADLEASKRGVGTDRIATLARAVDALAQQRESVAADRARCETERAAALKQLEGYLGNAQQLGLLAREKQLATSKLFTVQKTAEYLDRAREALDGRYLGGLTDRFNDYAASWLDDDTLDMDVDGDFEVSVREGAAEHDVASYSTGYQDLLDVCLRMALVDTVFEAEQPFIVMDDPFTNLDQAKLSRALMLLALLARGKQIIYFTCHPSRTEAGGAQAEAAGAAPLASFTLPAQRASHELPRARARRQAEERVRTQVALVASYRVAGPTQGRASVRVADARRTITSNMVCVRFSVSLDSGGRDNAFDVHFIDAQGRSLCERQGVEVIDGRLVPERLTFCLSTKPDSGQAFDLIVHEHDRPENELAARVPFKADIAFSADNFGL